MYFVSDMGISFYYYTGKTEAPTWIISQFRLWQMRSSERWLYFLADDQDADVFIGKRVTFEGAKGANNFHAGFFETFG